MRRRFALGFCLLSFPVSFSASLLGACSDGSPAPGLPFDAGVDAHVAADATLPDASADAPVAHHDAMPSSDVTPPPVDASTDASDAADAAINPSSWDQNYPRPTDSAGTTGRAACQYKRGDMPAQTLGPGTALYQDIPIEHVIVVVQENHSFDSYLGHLAAYEAAHGIVPAPDGKIESAPDSTTNPDVPAGLLDGGATTGSHPYQHAPQLCEFDTSHSWGGSHIDWDNGKLDGFYYMNVNGMDTGEPSSGVDAGLLSGERALWWYDERDIPFYYSLYSTFAMADHYHCGILGPTWPNRMYVYSATSFGETSNAWPDISNSPYPQVPIIIFDELEERAVSWNLYTEGAPGAGVVLGVTTGIRYPSSPTLPVTQFFDDVKNGTLPAVSFVDGDNLNEGPTGDDEHPPGEIEIGQHFIWEIVNAVTTGPLWKNTVLFVTYDEGGGLYDHVEPPSACAPDGIAPIVSGGIDQTVTGNFTQAGFRVPFIAISPYSKKSYVSHTTYNHASIPRFIEARWKLPALTARDANADPFTDMFDWKNPPFMTPPTFPEPTIHQAAVTSCVAEYPDAGGGL